MTEQGSIRFGDTDIDYLVTRSVRRKKTIEITLDHQDGILVAAPVETPSQHIADVVRKRAGWIIRTANGNIVQASRKQLVSGESLPYLGRQVRLYVGPSSVSQVTVSFSHWSFKVEIPLSLNGEKRRLMISKALEIWYRRRAAVRLNDRLDRWVSAVGCEPKDVLIRNQRQRWGSCSPDGALRFNWRVIQLEPSLIDYVVVHELAHLLIRNHSGQFWDVVGRVLPDYRLRRQRLKEAGAHVVL